jgi:hypothetical protein
MSPKQQLLQLTRVVAEMKATITDLADRVKALEPEDKQEDEPKKRGRPPKAVSNG